MYKNFTFSTSHRYNRPVVEVEVSTRRDDGAWKFRRIEMTKATYRRFVHLANSGRYNVMIEPDEDTAWNMSRRAA